MEDEYDYTDPTGYSADMRAFAAREMSGLPQQVRDAYTQEQEARRRIAQQRAAQFQQAQETIRQSRLGAPSRAQELFALSQAFLSPKPYKGFAGTLANVVPALGQISGAKTAADEKRQQMLMTGQQQFDNERAQMALDELSEKRKMLMDLGKYYQPMLKAPPRPRVVFSPELGGNVNLDTNTVAQVRPEPPVSEVQALARYMADPTASQENKRITAQNFERTYGVSAAQYLNGGR